MLFGHFGDKIGRKAMLSLTIIIMGLGTFLIGCPPDLFSDWRLGAHFARSASASWQGIGIGGEWGGAVLMVVESVPAQRRGFFGSIVQLGYPLGVILSTGAFALATLLPESDFLSWGWRVPFLASIFLVAIGLFIRCACMKRLHSFASRHVHPSRACRSSKSSGNTLARSSKPSG